jgi:hypothetical protein
MDPSQLNLLFGWSAILSAVATIVTLVTGILFFSLGGVYGKINDAASVVQMFLMVPVAAALFFLTRIGAPGLAMIVVAIGVVGLLAAAVLQALLVVGAVDYEETIAAGLSAGGVIGLWLLLANALALIAGVLPAGLTIAGMVAGVGYILLVIGFRLGGQQHPLFYSGSGLAVLGYTIWGTWLGLLFLSGSLSLG